MKDNEYYYPSDTKKSVSDEKKTLVNQETTIVKKRLIPKLNKKKKAKQGALNQSAALVMSSVAVLMVSLDAFPANTAPDGFFIGEWESVNSSGLYMEIDTAYDIIFSSNLVYNELVLTPDEVTNNEINMVIDINEEYGEVLANFAIEYEGQYEGVGVLNLQREDDSVILTSTAFGEIILFEKVNDVNSTAEKLSLWQSDSGKEMLVNQEPHYENTYEYEIIIFEGEEDATKYSLYPDENNASICVDYTEYREIIGFDRVSSQPVFAGNAGYRRVELSFINETEINMIIDNSGKIALNEKFYLKEEDVAKSLWEEKIELIEVIVNTPYVYEENLQPITLENLEWGFDTPYAGIWEGESEDGKEIKLVITEELSDSQRTVLIAEIDYFNNTYSAFALKESGYDTVSDDFISSNGQMYRILHKGNMARNVETLYWDIYIEGDTLIYNTGVSGDSEKFVAYTLTKTSSDINQIQNEWQDIYTQSEEE